MTNLETEILYYIKTNHRGKANSITYKKLSLALDINSRLLRKTVSNLVNNGQARIGSSSKVGYFYIDTKDELLECYKEMRKRGLKTLVHARGLLRSDINDRQIEKPKQLELLEA